MRAVSNINAITAGAELYYDGAQPERARRNINNNTPFLVSLYYQLGQWLSLGTSMKVHRHVTDLMDVRVGARW